MKPAKKNLSSTMLCVYANGEIINENNVSATMSPRQCFLVVGGGHILTFCFHTVFFFPAECCLACFMWNLAFSQEMTVQTIQGIVVARKSVYSTANITHRQ